MRQVSGLQVVECKYCYNKWTVEIKDGQPRFCSQVREYRQPRDVDLYHRSGLYERLGVPVERYEVERERYPDRPVYAAVTRDFSDGVCRGAARGDVVLAVGGYCNYAPAIVGGLQRALGADRTIGVVWMDAHGDCRLPQNVTGPVTLVGVPMSTLLGLTLPEYRVQVCGLEVPCRGENVVAGDLRIMDEATATALSGAKVCWLDGTAFADEGRWRREITRLAGRVDALYLAVDADILRAEYIPAYEKTVPYGQELETVARNIRIAMETGKVAAFSMFCFDFDRYECGGEQTYASGMKLIRAGLDSWKECPLP